ncbi:MAG: HgcAB-like fusion protein [Pseudomonadota bacterium]
MTAAGWIVSYLARWLPHAAPTGLFAAGEPDESSPVIVTANFSLTVERVKKALRGRSAWLLVANTDGINVWCAAGGGIFTANRVIDAIKISGLADRVGHRSVLLPALAAPGIDIEAVGRETGFRVRFGPVQAADIPAYLDAGMKKTDAMRRFRFDLRHRLDMFVPMNLPVYLFVAAVLAIVKRDGLLGFTAIFWGAVAFLYLFINVIPGKTGWGQAMFSAAALIAAWAGVDWLTAGDPLAHWGWLVATLGIFFAAGFDLAGIVSPRRSDAEMLMHRLGFKSFGSMFSAKDLGDIALDRGKCSGCGKCRGVCPVGVFGDPGGDGKTMLHDGRACFSCGACVKQCPENALQLK